MKNDPLDDVVLDAYGRVRQITVAFDPRVRFPSSFDPFDNWRLDLPAIQEVTVKEMADVRRRLLAMESELS